MKKKLILILIIIFALIGGGTFTYFQIQNNNLKLEQEKIEKAKQLEIEKEKAVKREALFLESEKLFTGYYVDEAIALLKKDESLINDEVNNKIKEYETVKNNYVLYQGEVQHIFFHSLILYPEYLFRDITVPTGGYNEGFSYRSELERMLPLLLENGFILYNINDVYGKDENGIMKRKDIYLPEGKKPLILSIDDPAYSYGVGFANKMIIDENGELATEVITPERETIITHDGDVELVVNNFIDEHPEFSYRGARGVIATTAWEGFFGYDLETEESKNSAIQVANKLKEEGWLFASHSYTHNRMNFFGPNSSAGNIAYDTREWKSIMNPIIGETNLFIAPFGFRLTGAGLNVIIDNGFDIYCIVSSKAVEEVYDNYALMSRIEMGGYSYNYYAKYINEHLFDVSKVKDSYRPPVLSS